LPHVNVSVVIPTYNSSETLKLALQSVLWQDFKNFDVWVIGDGCTDDSEKAVTSYNDPRVHWHNLPKNSGSPGLPRSEGINHSTGQYIAYIGHDDLWFPWHLSELVDCIETNRSDFVYSLGAIIAPEGVLGMFSLPKEAWTPNETVSPINWLHRRSLLAKNVSWPRNMKYGDDREFLQRLRKANVRVDFRKELSVMKFPAQSWRTYSIRNSYPQQKYVLELGRDAFKLRNELLELAASAPPLHAQARSFHRKLLDQTAFHLLHLYGFQRWPVNQLLYRRYRKRSGLSAQF
jgi:glycosyltransferase involved in cell wall biosynthesis